MNLTFSYEISIKEYEAVATNYSIVELINGDIIVTTLPSVKHQIIVIGLLEAT